jgi:hypothetical protein
MAADLPAASHREGDPAPPTEQRHDADTDVDTDDSAGG